MTNNRFVESVARILSSQPRCRICLVLRNNVGARSKMQVRAKTGSLVTFPLEATSFLLRLHLAETYTASIGAMQSNAFKGD